MDVDDDKCGNQNVSVDKMSKKSRNRSEIQDKQYDFPYHHIPYFDDTGTAKSIRSLSWGLDYLCYLKHLCEEIHSYGPQSLLDVGCGDGRLLGTLGPEINEKVGVDLSEKAIRFARAFHPEITFHQTKVADLNAVFDVVTAIEVLEHIPDDGVSMFLRSLNDRVKPGGMLVISVPTKVIPLQEKHYRHYDRQLLLSQLNEANIPFEVIRCEYLIRKDFLYKLYLKITRIKLLKRSYGHFQLNLLDRWMWSRLWDKLKYATEKNGEHLIVILRKRHGVR